MIFCIIGLVRAGPAHSLSISMQYGRRRGHSWKVAIDSQGTLTYVLSLRLLLIAGTLYKSRPSAKTLPKVCTHHTRPSLFSLLQFGFYSHPFEGTLPKSQMTSVLYLFHRQGLPTQPRLVLDFRVSVISLPSPAIAGKSYDTSLTTSILPNTSSFKTKVLSCFNFSSWPCPLNIRPSFHHVFCTNSSPNHLSKISILATAELLHPRPQVAHANRVTRSLGVAPNVLQHQLHG